MSKNDIAFVFPGQGSQQMGMLATAHEEYSVVRDTFAEASQALGYDMWTLIQNGPQDALNLTETTQPLMLTSSVALWRAWEKQVDSCPAIMAGHSLGEFSALVCAGALDFTETVKLVRKRGEFMQAAVPVGQGAMAAVIGLEDADIVRICAEVSDRIGGIASAVNFNSPGQVVIAGHVGTVEAASIALKEAGAKKVMHLPVSAPFHTQLMMPASDQLAEAIADIKILSPRVPVVHNVHAATERDPEEIRRLLIKQIYSPVQWTACVLAIIQTGARHVVECGPGKVLSGLCRRIDKSLMCHSLEEPEGLRAAAVAIESIEGDQHG